MPNSRYTIEDYFLTNITNLKLALTNNGYPEHQKINGFSLYQIRQPHQQDNLPGRFFAVRESASKQNEVEKAILWTARSLEYAVAALNKLPSKSSEKETRPRFIPSAKVSVSLVLFVTTTYFTNNPLIAGGFAISYLFGLPVLRMGNNYIQWQSSMERFSDVQEGRGAISQMLQLAEIHRYRV